MREIYRLMRLKGRSPGRAAFVAVLAPMVGLGPWTRFTLMNQRLDALPDDNS